MIREGALRVASVALTVSMMAPVPVRADVLEIASDGSIHVRSGAGVALYSSPPDETEEFSKISSEALTWPGTSVAALAFAGAMNRMAARYDLSQDLLEALIWQESRWRPVAVSPVGAMGLTQLMPGTARDRGVDPRDPVANIQGRACYLCQQLDRFDGNVEKALAAYNAGPGRVIRAGGIPPIAETRNHVSAIFDRLAPAGVTKGD